MFVSLLLNYYTEAWYILCMYNTNNGKTRTISIPIIKIACGIPQSLTLVSLSKTRTL